MSLSRTSVASVAALSLVGGALTVAPAQAIEPSVSDTAVQNYAAAGDDVSSSEKVLGSIVIAIMLLIALGGMSMGLLSEGNPELQGRLTGQA